MGDDDLDDGDDLDGADDFDIDHKINHSPPRNVMFWLKMSGVKFLLTTHTRPQWKAYLDIKVIINHETNVTIVMEFDTSASCFE